MIVTEISISNYRGVVEKQVVPLSNFSSVIGKNDSGKSIILNALATFLDIKSHEIKEFDFNDKSKEIIIECKFSDENLRDIVETKVKSKIKKSDGLDTFLDDIIFENSIIVQKIISTVGKKFKDIKLLVNDYIDKDFSFLYLKNDNELNALIKKYKISIPIEGIGRNSKLEKIKYIKKFCTENNIQKEQKYILDEYKIDTLLPAIELFESDYGLEADTSFKTNSVSEIKDFFEQETKDKKSRLNIVEEAIQSEMSKEAESIKNYMSDYTSALDNVKITPMIDWKSAIKSVEVSFKFNGDKNEIPMSHKGTGYRRLFMVARFRYLAEKNKGQNVIYLIEEPETFLHPSAQEDLLKSLIKLSKEKQIIITTHSPVFVGKTNCDSVILCQKEEQSLYSYGQGDEDVDFIHKVVNELGIKPYFNLVDNFEKILFVEGSNDIAFYKLLSKKLLDKELEEKVLILPFGGKMNVDNFVNIKYFENSNRDLFLILDSDKHLSLSEQEAQKQKIQEFELGKKSKAYLLERSYIEHYYHPRAIERLFSLVDNSIPNFPNDKTVQNILKDFQIQYEKQYGKIGNFKLKNNIKIFENMTKEEWEEVVELELIDFIKLILS